MKGEIGVKLKDLENCRKTVLELIIKKKKQAHIHKFAKIIYARNSIIVLFL